MSNENDSKTAGDKVFWDKAAQKYSKSKIGDQEGYEKTLREVAKWITKSSNVIEVGCGTGSTALRLAPYVGSYLATDISPEMIAIANEKLANELCQNLKFAANTIETVPPQKGGYDAVLGFNYLHLVPDVDATLHQANNLLKKGALLITKTPCLSEMNFLIGWLIPVLQLFKLGPASIASFSADELEDKIRSAGFEIESVERHGSKAKDSRPYIVARKI